MELPSAPFLKNKKIHPEKISYISRNGTFKLKLKKQKKTALKNFSYFL